MELPDGGQVRVVDVRKLPTTPDGLALTVKSDLRCVSIIVMQQPAESFTTFDLAINAADPLFWLNQSIAEALVVPFHMIVLKELVHGFPY